jgi:hypothetical protein
LQRQSLFYANRFDIRAGESVWTGRTGTREAVHRDGFLIAPSSLRYCPHQWIDDRGYVDRELARKYPYRHHEVART